MSAALRRAIIAAARRMNELGINQGTSGNLSVRWGDGFLVTPSGMEYDSLKPSDIVTMDMAGRAKGARSPSSEWRIHRDILASRPEAGAVLHAHPPYATTLACLGRGIPAFHYMVAMAGGDSIRCAPYATFGTEALSKAALAALRGRRACLMANHGMVVFGRDLGHALRIALEVETLAGQYWRALQIGRPKLLSKAEMKLNVEKFKTYGVQPRRESRRP
ncbi:MAG: class II aldolase/adducin family protein [Alphaproteobacteria bacterium]